MNLEEDVNFCIFSMYETMTTEEIVAILKTTIDSHGLVSVIKNLESRNRTRVIGDLLVILHRLESH